MIDLGHDTSNRTNSKLDTSANFAGIRVLLYLHGMIFYSYHTGSSGHQNRVIEYWEDYLKWKCDTVAPILQVLSDSGLFLLSL